MKTFTLENVEYGYAEISEMCVVILVRKFHQNHQNCLRKFTKISDCVDVDDLKIRILFTFHFLLLISLSDCMIAVRHQKKDVGRGVSETRLLPQSGRERSLLIGQ